MRLSTDDAPFTSGIDTEGYLQLVCKGNNKKCEFDKSLGRYVDIDTVGAVDYVSLPETQGVEPRHVARCVDAHYYLEKNFFRNISDLEIHVAGIMFPAIPGNYMMPFSEGSFTINQGRVTMCTKNSGYSYHHLLVYPSSTD